MKTELREFESEDLIRIGGYTVSRLGRDEQNIDEDSETYLVTYQHEGGMSGSVPFNSYEDAKAYAYKRAGIVDPDAEPKAPAKPLWQMDARHRLGLTPGRNDAISRLLMSVLYAAEDQDEFENMVQNHIDELRKAVELLKARAK